MNRNENEEGATGAMMPAEARTVCKKCAAANAAYRAATAAYYAALDAHRRGEHEEASR